MSEGTVYQRKDSRWCGKYKALDGTWKYVYRKTKNEAKKALRQALKDRDDGVVPTDRSVTVGTLVEDWLRDTKEDVAERTYRSRKSLVNVHIRNQDIASKNPSSLTGAYVKRLYASKTPATAQRIHTLLKTVLDGQMPKVKKPRNDEEREIKVLAPEQVKTLLSHVRGSRYECVFVLGATCGLRIGEILALRWTDVDLIKGTLTVRHTLWKGRILPPKTRSSKRTIKLPTLAREALQQHTDGSTGFLFRTKTGHPLDESNFHTWFWKPALRAAGLPDIHFHDLRHGIASLMLSRNVPIPAVSKYLGHKDSAITMRVYAHVLEGMEDAASDGIDGALG